MARFRVGLITSFATGYVLGAKAGRERYEQIMATWNKVKASPAFHGASDKVGAAIGLGIERSRVVALESINKATAAVRNRNSG